MTAILDQLIAAEVRLAGPADDAADAVAALVRSKVSLKEDGTLDVFHSRIDGSAISLSELLSDLKRDKPALFKQAKTASASSCSPAASTTNPWKPGAQNLTEQMALLKRDPALAARLKAEAGAR